MNVLIQSLNLKNAINQFPAILISCREVTVLRFDLHHALSRKRHGIKTDQAALVNNTMKRSSLYFGESRCIAHSEIMSTTDTEIVL